MFNFDSFIYMFKKWGKRLNRWYNKIEKDCYFNRIPEDDNLLKLVLGNCWIKEYEL